MPWVKGQSGNPKGAPKRTDRGRLEYTKMIRGYIPLALEALVQALQGDDRVAAVKVILAYGLGKPAEMQLTLSEIPDDVLWAEAQRRYDADRRRRAAEETAAGASVDQPI